MIFGALRRMALEPGLKRILWVAIGAFFSPVLEEILFRGVLYGGYRKSFGGAWAAVLTTVLFAGIHFPQAIRYPPQSVSCVLLSVAALWCKLRAGAIGPAIAVHSGANAMLVLIWLIRTH
jgi:membrane protease YdiL (CAAX protease family)